MFKRRKSRPCGENAAPNAATSETPRSHALVGPPSWGPHVAAAERSGVPQDVALRFSDALDALGARAASTPEALTSLVAAICEAELARPAADRLLSAALRSVLEEYLESLGAALRRGDIGCCGDDAAGSDVGEPAWDASADLEARKAGLRARLEAYRQEEADWERLLDSVTLMPRAAGGQDAEVSTSAKAAHAISAGPAQLPSERESFCPAGTGGGTASADGVDRAEIPVPALDPTTTVVLEELQSAWRSVHSSLSIRVEGVGLLMGDITELTDMAMDAARTLQVRTPGFGQKRSAHPMDQCKCRNAACFTACVVCWGGPPPPRVCCHVMACRGHMRPGI